eukprot:10701486-Alexandrium_andersonii.AAC.1
MAAVKTAGDLVAGPSHMRTSVRPYSASAQVARGLQGRQLQGGGQVLGQPRRCSVVGMAWLQLRRRGRG